MNNSKIQRLNFERRYWFYFALIIICGLILYQSRFIGVDFRLLYPAGRAVLSLHDPYEAAPYFFNPPWFLIFITPISLFPLKIARIVWMVLGIIGYLIAFKRLNLNQFSILAMFLSPFIYFDLSIGNYEWLILLGSTLPAVWGSWFVITKPQTGIVLIPLWIKQKKWVVMIPLVLLGILMLLGLYALPKPSALTWSADIFPYGIPIGLILGYFAFKNNDQLLALAAAPFFTPYLAVQSWIFVLLPLTRNKKWMGIGVILSWIFVMIFFGVRS